MAIGDQYRCDWCGYTWRTKSDTIPWRCPSCSNGNIVNEVEKFKEILGKENILLFNKKKKKEEKIEEEKVEKRFFKKFLEKIKKK